MSSGDATVTSSIGGALGRLAMFSKQAPNFGTAGAALMAWCLSPKCHCRRPVIKSESSERQDVTATIPPLLVK